MAIFGKPQLFARTPAGIRIFERAELRHTYWEITVLAAIGAISSAVALIVFRHLHEQVTELGIPLAILSCGALVVTIVLRRRERSGWLFDSKARRATRDNDTEEAEPTEYSYSDLGLVRMESREHHVSTREAEYTEILYSVWVVPTGPDLEHDLKAARAARSRDEESEDNRKSRGITGLGTASPERISESTDPTGIWRLAEGLGRELEVPVLDGVGERSSLRWPDELDTPLIEQLGRMVAIPRETPEAPAGATVTCQDEQTILTFRAAFGGHVMLLAFAAIPGLVATAWNLFHYQTLSRWGLIEVAVCATCIALLSVIPRRSTITIDREAVTYNSGWGFTHRFRQSRLEGVRVTSPCAIALMGDHKTVYCVQRAPESSDWMYTHLLRGIVSTRDGGTSSDSAQPYR